MSETGHTWQRAFKAHPVEAASVRSWAAGRALHLEAPAIANELFVAVLGSQTEVVDMTISTAGSRLRITAEGATPLLLRQRHGPGWVIVGALSMHSGVTSDGRGLWAQLRTDS